MECTVCGSSIEAHNVQQKKDCLAKAINFVRDGHRNFFVTVARFLGDSEARRLCGFDSTESADEGGFYYGAGGFFGG